MKFIIIIACALCVGCASMKSLQVPVNDRNPVVSVKKSGLMTKTFTVLIDNEIVMEKRWPVPETVGTWHGATVRMTGRFQPGIPGRFLITVTVNGSTADFTFIN